MCGYCGSDCLYKINVCFLQQILILSKYIGNIRVVFLVFWTVPWWISRSWTCNDSNHPFLFWKSYHYSSVVTYTQQASSLDRTAQCSYPKICLHQILNFCNAFRTAVIYTLLSSGCFLQIEYEEKKKAEGKKARDDKESVLEMLFAAFEKHQYYNIRDLVKITRQPIVRF